MTSHYWTCSKFADWLRGTPKIKMGTAEQWDDWEENAKAYSPIRYWLADDGIRILERIFYFVPDTIHSVKYYINNRYITRTHALTASPVDIKPGTWMDVGHRFLPCMFNELRDFVEVELAWWHIAWAEKDEKAKYKAPFWATGWFRWRTWRCPQAGLDNLEWQRNLRWTEDECGPDSKNVGKLTPQAEKAQEILDLYTWWTTTYRNRPDPYDASGWTAACEALREANGGGVLAMFKKDGDPKLKKASDKAHKILQKIEADYEKEDEQMMIRLIKVRHGLWT